MKNRVLFYVLSIALTAFISVCLCGLCTENYIREHIQAKSAVVTEIDRYSDFVTAKSEDGNTYYFYGARDYYVGDVCSLLINNGGTKIVVDDYLISHSNDNVVGFLEALSDKSEY